MSDRVAIKVRAEDKALVNKYKKARGIEDDAEAIDRVFDMARARFNALETYAAKQKKAPKKKATTRTRKA